MTLERVRREYEARLIRRVGAASPSGADPTRAYRTRCYRSHRGQLKSGPGPGSTKLNMQRPEILVTSYALTVLRNPELVCTTSKASACERTRALGLDGACPMHPQGRASTISVPLGATGTKAPSETTPTAPSARRTCASVKTVRLSGPKEFLPHARTVTLPLRHVVQLAGLRPVSKR
jgi:hypothetical protein